VYNCLAWLLLLVLFFNPQCDLFFIFGSMEILGMREREMGTENCILANMCSNISAAVSTKHVN
jgi:hypothetical protein